MAPGGESSRRSALFGYAVLRANYNHAAPNYLDNFTGFVLDVLNQARPEPLDETSVGQAVRDNFGLTIPDRVAGLLLRRAVKAGKASSDDGKTFTVDATAAAGVQGLQASIATYETQQAEVMSKFLDFVRSHHPERLMLVEDDAERHLHAFIEEHAVPLLRRAERGRRAETQWSDLQGPDYLIAAFILYLVEHDSQTFAYVVDAVKGAILTGVLDLGPGDLQRNLRDLTLVLDTPVLLKALGYLGEAQQRAVQQTLDLARSLNVKTVCFTHTSREIDGVMESVIPVLQSRGKTSGSLRAVDAHYLDRGASAADILLDQNRIQSDLQELGVRLVEPPDNRYQFGLDEAALDDLLKKHLPTQRENTRRYDVESLSALHRLREGSSPDTFERCGFVFLTDNWGLINAARLVDERHRWPLAMFDGDVAALLWVRSPAAADDLPREQLLATVYAGMQPGSHLWQRYIEEIERLETVGDVNEDEAIILRSRPEARRALMDATLGDAEGITGDSIETVVERVREGLEGHLRELLGKTEAQLDQALQAARFAEAAAEAQSAEVARIKRESEHTASGLQSRLADLETKERRQGEHIQQEACRRAKRRVLWSIALLAMLLVVPAALQLLAPQVVAGLHPVGRYGALAGGVLIFILAGARHFFGGSVKDWLKPLETRLAQRLERKARLKAGLPPAPD